MNLNIGPLAFQWAHIVVLASVMLAIGVGKLVGRKQQVGIADVVFDMALAAALAGRVVFVGLWFSLYRNEPWSILDIRDGGFEPWSALLGAVGVAVWRVRQQPALLRPLVSGVVTGVVAWSAMLFAGLHGAPSNQGVPALSLKSLEGAPVSLKAAAPGRLTVLNLWASWCPPCRHEMPAFARAQQLYPQVDFIFVNQGESPEAVRRYLQMAPFRLDQVLLDEGSLLSTVMQSSALPTTLIYGPDGRLVFSRQGPISEAVLAMQLASYLGGASGK